MNISKEMLGLGAMLFVNMLLLAGAWGKLQQALADLQHTTTERLGRIERAIGIEDGETTFMRRTECSVLDAGLRSDLMDVKARLTELEKQVHTLVARSDLREG